MADKNKLADEIMSEEELDKVAGGELPETMDDMYFLNKLNGSCKVYDDFYTFSDNINRINREIEDAWATVGIKAYIDTMNDNEYYLNGKRISQKEAYQHAKQVVGSK